MSYFSRFLEWFHEYAKWDVIGWLAIVGVGAYWEIMGAIYKDRTTFTDLVRSFLPQHPALRIPIVLAITGVLFWHFALQKANYR